MSKENDYIETEEVLEEEVETEEVETEQEDNESEEIDWKERALKAEQAIIKSKSKKQKAPVKKESVSNYQSQVDLLRFNGVSSEEIDKLKRIAELDGTDLIDARNSEDFAIWKEKTEKAQALTKATTKTTNRGTVSKESLDKIKARVMAGTASPEDRARILLGKKD